MGSASRSKMVPQKLSRPVPLYTLLIVCPIVYMLGYSVAPTVESPSQSAHNEFQIADTMSGVQWRYGPAHQCTQIMKKLPGSVLDVGGRSPRSLDGPAPEMKLKTVETRIQMIDLVDKMGLLNKAVEVGVWQGGFSKQILSTWKGNKLYMVDAWEHNSDYPAERGSRTDDMNKAENSVEKYTKPDGSKRYELVQGWSHQAAGRFADGEFDFIYLDATHTYSALRQDIVSWYPKLKVGGVMAGHDYRNRYMPSGREKGDELINDRFFAVKDAVDAFAGERNLRVYVVSQPGGGSEFNVASWYLIKC